MRNWCATAFSVFLFIVASIITLATANLSSVARLVPLFVLVPTLALLGLQVGLDGSPQATRGLRRAFTGLAPDTRRVLSEKETEVEAGRPLGVAILLPVAFLASILVAGLGWGPPLVTMAYLRLVNKETWARSAAIALALAVVLWLLFAWALDVTLYKGLMF